LHLGHEVTSFTKHCHHDVMPPHGPKNNGANQLWPETYRTVSQNNPFVFIS
jgi:hypothetical protein